MRPRPAPPTFLLLRRRNYTNTTTTRDSFLSRRQQLDGDDELGAQCRVHVKIWPRPRGLSESTDVLRVLQRYGEVVMFKHLKHEPNVRAPNSALAIFRSPDAARKVMSASPIRFVYGRVSAAATSAAAADRGQVQEFGSDGVEELGRSGGDNVVMGGEDEVGAGVEGESESENEFFTATDGRRLMQGEEGEDTEKVSASEEALERRGGLRIEEEGEGEDDDDAINLSWPPMTVKRPRRPSSSSSSSSAPPDLDSDTDPDPDNTNSPSSSSSSHSSSLSQEPEPRPCTISIKPSALDHAAYIARQAYYSGFRTDPPTYPGAALLGGTLPPGMHGLVNSDLNKGEPPLRIRRRGGAGGGGLSLMELWERGVEKRKAAAAAATASATAQTPTEKDGEGKDLTSAAAAAATAAAAGDGTTPHHEANENESEASSGMGMGMFKSRWKPWPGKE